MNKGLEALKRRYPDKVESYYRDSDGIWLDLKPGWSRWGEVHAIHEMTTREIAEALREEVIPCPCDDCRRMVIDVS